MEVLKKSTMRSSSSSSSSKQSTENNRGISGHMVTLHRRLYHALNLGFRSYDKKGRIWHFKDIEIQRLVVRSIDAFLDCITNETSQHPLVKDSIADMVGALGGILQFKNECILRLASTVAVQMVSVLPSSTFQSHLFDLVRPLSSLLSSPQLQVAISCATALSSMLSNLSIKREREVWEILKETNTVFNIIRNIQDFPSRGKPVEYFKEMAYLLSKILWRWPPSRFRVWSDAKLMDVLDSISLEPEFCVKVAVLQLYSTLALCGNAAKKLLENGETLLQVMVHCMRSSNPHSIQMEGFKLAQCLAISEQGCLKMMKMCCEPLVKAIISGMSNWSSHSGKLSKDQMSLLEEACRLAMITRWAGEHHSYFWKLGVDKVLLDLLLNNFHKTHQSQQALSIKDQIAIAQEGLSANFLLVLRPYIWDILGWLAAHSEDLNPKMHGNELHTDILITCACLAFVDSIRAARQICQNDISNTVGGESASRAVLMMIYSPSKYISSQAKSVLSEILKLNVKDDIRCLLDTLNAIISGNKFWMQNNLQLVINLMSLACYSALPYYRKRVIKSQGIKTLLAFLRWWLSNPVPLKRPSVAPHLHNPFNERTCCYDSAEEWEGNDMILLFVLWGLAELIHHSGFVKNHADLFASQMDYSEAQFLCELQEICSDTCSPGSRWYAAYILSYFGLYGFPNKLGRRIEKALKEDQFTDVKLILTDQESLSVHGVILMVRCPSLIPPGEMSGSSVREDMKMHGRLKEVRLSAHVDRQALLKLLEFVYLGYLQAGEELVKKLKIIARHCNLHPLYQMLCRRTPKWGAPIPNFDLALALGPAGHHFSDIILEAKASELVDWACSTCSSSMPHMHVHKVILCSSCDYLRALFQSGMLESQSHTIKVPVNWEALVKLVNWFYSGEMSKPMFGCLWHNLETEEKLHEVEPYVELCWLAEFWLLREVHEECSSVIISCLDSDRYLSVKIIQLAANFSQWKLAEVAANYMAPLYHRLRNSGDLDDLDEELIEMVRVASVRLSQEGIHQP